jgi:hypothetical protein
MDCEAARERIVLDLYGELGPEERATMEEHLRGCAGCGAARAAERRLRLLLSQEPTGEPPHGLLDRCRADLAAALARESPIPAGAGGDAARAAAGGLRPPSFALPWRRLRLSPVLGGTLLVAGVLLGRVLPGAGGAPSGDPGAAPGEAPVASVSDIDAGPESGLVRLRYDLVRRATLEGTTADPGIRRLLVRTVREHPNDGLRLRAMEALRDRTGDAEVRAAFQEAALRDPNTGARLRAIDALAGSAAGDPGVRGAILQALLGDDNPGVRVRALDVLETARGPESRTIFERLAREDPNDYVRFRSAAFAGGAVPAAERR